VRDSRLETAGAVGAAPQAPVRTLLDLVVSDGPRPARRRDGGAELDRLDCGNGKQRLADAPVELEVPRGERAESRRNAARPDENRSSEGLSLLTGRVDRGDHALLDPGVERPQRRILFHAFESSEVARRHGVAGLSDREHAAPNLDAALPQQELADRAGG